MPPATGPASRKTIMVIPLGISTKSRTSNKANEITGVSETAGPSWTTPALQPGRQHDDDPATRPIRLSRTPATYDAWNRLVKLEDGADTVAEHVFDGAKRLVVRKKYVSGSLSQTRHFYYTSQWQTIEERLESGGSILSTADRQFTWGLRYIDDLVCRTVSSAHDYAYQDANWNVILSSSARWLVWVTRPTDRFGLPVPPPPRVISTIGSTTSPGYRRDEGHRPLSRATIEYISQNWVAGCKRTR